MIDIATVEEYMRAANPIPTLDAVDADELAFAVAGVDTRRAAAMQAPTQHPRETATPPAAPPPTRRKAWAFAAAFVVILVVIGAAAFFLGGDEAQVTDEPPPQTTVVDSTLVSEDALSMVDLGPTAFTEGWRQVAVDEPWIDSIVGIEALAGGGFVAVTSDPMSAVVWSPDGVEWRDGDPENRVTVLQPDVLYSFTDVEAPLMTVAGDDVVILSDTSGVWVGDPRSGRWDLVPLDTGGVTTEPRLLTVGSSDTQAMVIAEVTEGKTAAWLIDLAEGTTQRRPLPTAPYDYPDFAVDFGFDPLAPGDWARVEWFNGRWLVMPSCGDCSLVFVSTDGTTWVSSTVTWAVDAPPLPRHPEDDEVDVWRPGNSWSNIMVFDMAAGPDAIVAAYWAPRSLAYSEDGVRWLAKESRVMADEAMGYMTTVTYSNELGYVARNPDGYFIVSNDGQTWRSAGHQTYQPVLRTGSVSNAGYRLHLAASEDQLLMASYGSSIGPHLASLMLWTAD